MLAMTFVFPMVLAAAGAAVAPIIIHLILRTKPRRIVFPAMRFVRKTHQANLSKLRLKHLILLLMRMAAIVLLAALIARGQLPQWEAVEERTSPAAAAFIIDNSLSMGYVRRGQTVLSAGTRLAQQVIDSLPAGSRVGVLPTEGAGTKAAFHADRKVVGEQLAGVVLSCGGRPIAPALARALMLLRDVELPRKEVYVVSDMTARSWRDLAVAADKLDKEVAFAVLNVGSGENANIALGEVRLDCSSAPQGAEVAAEATIRAGQVGGELELRAELNGQTVGSQAVSVKPGQTVNVTATFPLRQRGVAHGRLSFQQSDALEADNVRYFTLEVGPPASVLIVRDPTTVGRDAQASFLMGHAIAPAPAGPERAGWISRETITADRLDAARLAEARIIILTDVSALSEAQWQDLGRFVRGGGHVWVVIGPLVSPVSYNAAPAQQVLPAAFGALEDLPRRVAWRAERPSEPMLLPFAGSANPPLSEVLCRARFALGSLAPDAHVVLRYADGRPAIVVRPAGEGSSVLWNFSPVRELSNLAGLAQFPILAQWTARVLVGGAGEQTAYISGQTASVAIPKSMKVPAISIRRPGAAADQPVAPGPQEAVLNFRTDLPGHWTVTFTEGPGRVERGFSVNGDPAESDLTPADPEELARHFPPGRLTIATDLGGLVDRRRTVAQPLDLVPPILLGLLILLMGESFFANRFYRRDQSVQQTP